MEEQDETQDALRERNDSNQSAYSSMLSTYDGSDDSIKILVSSSHRHHDQRMIDLSTRAATRARDEGTDEGRDEGRDEGKRRGQRQG
ncbi:hypothetical protein LTR43_012576, partial [Exophiala xenobiotica]